MPQPSKIPTILEILDVNSSLILSANSRYLRIARIKYLQTSGMMLDEKVIVVGDGEGVVVIEDGKSRLVRA
jgi:hypothetical protein